jgi:fucose permease
LGAGGLLLFLDPLLLLRLQGRAVHLVTAGALVVFAGELVACGLAPHALVLMVAMVLGGPASGVACAFAQAALVGGERAEGRANAAERAASRWALAGALGDVAAPAVLAVVAGWRSAYLVGAAVAALLAMFVLRSPVGAGAGVDHADEPAVAPRFTLRELLASRRVLLAALAAAACTLLDEIVLAIGALYLADRFGLAAAGRSMVLGAWTVAALAGAFAVNLAVERATASRLMVLSGVACAIAFAAALWANSPVAATALLAIAGFFASWHWPLCEALALRAAGERPLLAAAASSLWSPLALAAPFVMAGVVGAFGSTVAMAVLLAQPLVVLTAGIGFGRSDEQSAKR